MTTTTITQSQIDLLTWLNTHGPASPQQMAVALSVGSDAVHNTLKGLERRGYVLATQQGTWGVIGWGKIVLGEYLV